jgi:hypothetical protein
MFCDWKIQYTNKHSIETQSQTGDQKLIPGVRWLLQIINKIMRKRTTGEETVKAEGRSDKEEAVIKAEGMKRGKCAEEGGDHRMFFEVPSIITRADVLWEKNR